ncbi:hypothetical protein ACLMJK_002961 [Lecanora helva]
MGIFSDPKPARTLYVYDKGSNYLLLDNDKTTPLYHVHFNIHTVPHMTVARAVDPDKIIGSAIFFPKKKAGVWASSSDIQLAIHDDSYEFNKEGGTFSTAKRTLRTQSHGTLYWKGGYAASGFMKLLDDKKRIVADYQNKMYTGDVMGVIEIMGLIDVDNALLDEIVVSCIAMLSEEKCSMTSTAANMSSAGALM